MLGQTAMKIAFCLGGAPRFKHRALFRTVAALKGADQIDIFTRTWASEYGQTDEEFEAYLRANLPDYCTPKITLVLEDNPVHYPPPRRPLNIADWSPNFLIMWWQMIKSYELYKQFVDLTGETYDLVFRMRTDTLPDRTIDLSQYPESSTHMMHSCNFNDVFFFGPPDLYDRTMGYWDYLDTLADTGEFIHPEESLEKYYQLSGIPYKSIAAEVRPVWDQGEYKGRPRDLVVDTWSQNLPT
jgi:hypothetical protein